jgi:hypothetical protein
MLSGKKVKGNIMAYTNLYPTPDKILSSDGSIRTMGGVIVSGPTSEGAAMYQKLSPFALKFLKADGSITDSLTYDGIELVGNVTSASSAFPTTRPAGGALVAGDYVIAIGSVFPFTLSGVVFKAFGDAAIYSGSGWLYDPIKAQVTSTVPVNSPATESPAGTSTSQSAINVETKTLLATLTGIHVKPTNICYVSKSGNDTTGDGSAVYPYLTIQAAINASSAGVTIYVYPGTYTESLTFKAGVNICAPSNFSVYVTGNHISSFTGTVVLNNIILQSTTGVTLTTSGSGAQNLQIVSGSVNSGTGDSIVMGNTNASSKISITDATVNVSTSGATARCVYAGSSAKGGMIANRTSFKLNNPVNVAISLSGSVSFTHTADTIYGTVSLSGTSSATIALVSLTGGTVACIAIGATASCILSSCILTTTANPAITGSGYLYYAAIIYGSTGTGGQATLNGGAGAQPLQFAPICIRTGALIATPPTGMLETDGTELYFTTSTGRKKVTLTSV